MNMVDQNNCINSIQTVHHVPKIVFNSNWVFAVEVQQTHRSKTTHMALYTMENNDEKQSYSLTKFANMLDMFILAVIKSAYVIGGCLVLPRQTFWFL